MNLDIHFIGTGGSVPQARRGLPATAVHHGNAWYLVDCGEGTQRQLLQSVGLKQFDSILITHMHTDHWLGLPSMLLTWTLQGRERPVHIWGPGRLKAAVESLADLKPCFPVFWHPVGPTGGFNLLNDLQVSLFEVKHYGQPVGFALQERDRPGKFNPEAASAALWASDDFGMLKREGRFTGPPRPGRKVVFTGDTSQATSVEAAAQGADLLVHEASFLLLDSGLASKTNHSTAWAAAQTAKHAAVKRLALNHILVRSNKLGALAEARPIFANTVVPSDFHTISIPMKGDSDGT